MKQKILIIILMILLLTIGSVVGVYYYFSNNFTSKDNDNQANNKVGETNNKKTDDFILESKQKNIDKLKFSDLSYYKDGKEYIGIITITNDTNNNIDLGQFQAKFKDKDGKLLGSEKIYALDIVLALESVEISFQTSIDLSKVNSIEYFGNQDLEDEDKSVSSNVKE